MAPLMLDGLDDYASTGSPRKYRSTAGSQETAPPARVEDAWTALERDGYVILENLFTPDEVARMRAAVLPHMAPRGGRNPFEGLKTRRLYAVIAKTLACNPLVEHPLVLALLDRVFEPNYLLSQLQVIDILPGEEAQALHFDDSFYSLPRPRPVLGAATIMALDDFTPLNGATRVIPGSHRWGNRLPTPEEADGAIPVVMPAGSVVLFLGTLWHSGGANRSERARLALTAQYCAPWCRQQENFSLSVPLPVVKQCSEHVRRMLGYSIHAPFMGMVDGMHPKRLLEDRPSAEV
ncbi:MAG: phytanoyl-CoA dioxygenase [Tistrella sp.]|uniref:Phytanoyl-CoA dioxygenase n=1 Tax=Tistrella mobilis TaxID=171437 RepID=A0A3B9ISU3_9PROT|nr:phytanoyl-CoA dioxygenase family protein [Tistrella sp.]MAD37310.1 phytanoyl-CoA dioxygenase [Tistrella sp.]MBA77965.1 phytanoyl-CoA dioxygenase [Tistrella sp.]HAE50931.1 phytanoyl-CoA dioxygenase [Tistrella mobilis]